MPISRELFDPLGVVVDWLDACRSGELNALLDLYDERATLECGSYRQFLVTTGPVRRRRLWADGRSAWR